MEGGGTEPRIGGDRGGRMLDSKPEQVSNIISSRRRANPSAADIHQNSTQIPIDLSPQAGQRDLGQRLFCALGSL